MAEADISWDNPQETLVEATPPGGGELASTRVSAQEAREVHDDFVQETQWGDMPATQHQEWFGGEEGTLPPGGGHASEECLVDTLPYDVPPESGAYPLASYEEVSQDILEACQEEVPVLGTEEDV